MAKDKLSIEDVFAKEKELETLKQQVIEELLEQKRAIDAQLARLGYTADQPQKATPVKKRASPASAPVVVERAKAETSPLSETENAGSPGNGKRRTQSLAGKTPELLDTSELPKPE